MKKGFTFVAAVLLAAQAGLPTFAQMRAPELQHFSTPLPQFGASSKSAPEEEGMEDLRVVLLAMETKTPEALRHLPIQDQIEILEIHREAAANPDCVFSEACETRWNEFMSALNPVRLDFRHEIDIEYTVKTAAADDLILTTPREELVELPAKHDAGELVAAFNRVLSMRMLGWNERYQYERENQKRAREFENAFKKVWIACPHSIPGHFPISLVRLKPGAKNGARPSCRDGKKPVDWDAVGEVMRPHYGWFESP